MKKILIVEDDKDFLWILKTSFTNQPFSMIYAENGEDGLIMAEKEKPDLILIDILLPQMDGITMAQKIKEKGLNPQMIFLTNLKDPNRISKVMETVGQADYIVKSDMHINDIIARVKDRLKSDTKQ